MGSRPTSTSSRPLVSRRIATTTYSVPRRRSATRRCRSTASSSASRVSRLRDLYSAIGCTGISVYADASRDAARQPADARGDYGTLALERPDQRSEEHTSELQSRLHL